MSGHSHAKTVKRTKDLEDKKRSQNFSKIARVVWIAAKEGGPNPETNYKLKSAIELARSVNMPKENIERAIKQAEGKIKSENLEEVTYEVYGPGGAAIIIEGITDNKNRALGEIRQALSGHGGKMISEGGIKWMFERKINQETKNLEWMPKQEIEITDSEKESCQKLFKSLEENESVQKIYHNIKK